MLITDCCFTRLCIIVFVACGGSGGGRGQSRYHPIISLTATCQNRVAGIDARRSCDADIAKSISLCLFFFQLSFCLVLHCSFFFSLQPGVRLMGVMMIGGIKRKEKRKNRRRKKKRWCFLRVSELEGADVSQDCGVSKEKLMNCQRSVGRGGHSEPI